MAVEVLEEPTLLPLDPLQVVTHVGRDVLANAAHFATVPKAIYEYVSNSIDATPPGQACTVRVAISNAGARRGITIADDAAGMSRHQLRTFFTMHGENAMRRAGRKVRGRFGTGKIAAFGRADRLRVETVQSGRRNVVELARGDLEGVAPGRAIPVRELVIDEPTGEADGTIVWIEELHRGTRVDRGDIARYLQRQLGRHLVRHRVLVEGERVGYVEPDSAEEHHFPAAPEIVALAGPLELIVKVASRPLTEEENGVAILCDGFLNAMTLAGIEGKAEAQYLFGELEAAVLDDDDATIPAFLATRDLTLNPWNPIVAVLTPWLHSSLEAVRRELVRRAHDRRRAAEEQELHRLGTDIATLLGAMYRGERTRLVAAPQPQALQAAPIEEPEEPRPRAPRRDRGIPRGPRPPRAEVLTPEPEPPTVPGFGSDRPLGAFRVLFRHGGESGLRAFYVPDERGIILNLDHPEAGASLANGGPTGPFFAHYCYRTALEEFTLAIVSELGYPDAPEIAREIRERADRYARAFAPAIRQLGIGIAEDEAAS